MSKVLPYGLFKLNSYLFCSFIIILITVNTGCEKTSASPTQYNAIDEPMEIVIDNGFIQLSKGTVLNIHEHDDLSQKVVSVKGRSFFDLSEDSELTWLVGADSLVIRAKGAAFSVWNKSGIIQIDVKHGKVLATKGKRKVEIFSGNRMIFSDDDMVVSHIPSINWFAWVDQVIQFENDNLRDVIRDLNHTFDIFIHVRNHTWLNTCNISKSFKNSTLTEILEILELEYGISSLREDNGSVAIIDTQC